MKVVVRPLERADLGGVARLRPLLFPDFPEAHDSEWHSSVWRWLGTHPLADRTHRWVLDAGGEVVGHLAAVPQYYRIEGQRVVAHTPADYLVLPGYGFYALSLMRKFFRTAENCVACDMLPAVIGIETRLGAEEVGKLSYAAKLLDVSRLPAPIRAPVPRAPNRAGSAPAHRPRPRASIPAPLKGLLNRGLRAADEALGSAFGGGPRVEVLEGFDQSFDELFERVAAAVPCVPEKDAAFLRWRYGPSSPTAPVTVLGARSEEGLLGYAVLRVTREGQDGYLLDLTTRPGRPDVARSLLREAVRHFARAGVHIVRYRFLESPASPRSKDLWMLGFFPRNKRRNTLLAKFADRGPHEMAHSAANWSYNIGDGEASFWVR